MRRTGPTPQVRALVLSRCRYACERCGRALQGYVSLHHRRPRRMGGTKRADANLPPNLLVLCGSGVTGCHGWVESNRNEAREEGFILYDRDDPAEIPYRDGSGRWWLLTAQGGRMPHNPTTQLPK